MGIFPFRTLQPLKPQMNSTISHGLTRFFFFYIGLDCRHVKTPQNLAIYDILSSSMHKVTHDSKDDFDPHYGSDESEECGEEYDASHRQDENC